MPEKLKKFSLKNIKELEVQKTPKTFLNKGTKHKKIVQKVKTQKIEIIKVADPFKNLTHIGNENYHRGQRGARVAKQIWPAVVYIFLQLHMDKFTQKI